MSAHAAESDFVFGIGVFNGEGISCYGSNTLLENYAAQRIQGNGRVG